MAVSMLDPFEQRRQQVLKELSSDELDKSRAGGVDARIRDFMANMNTHNDLYTTSSCSGVLCFLVPQPKIHQCHHTYFAHITCAAAGRISVFAEPSAETRAAGMKGGAWVYATHDLADTQSVLDSTQKSLASGADPSYNWGPVSIVRQ